jgi:hypothetical protein
MEKIVAREITVDERPIISVVVILDRMSQKIYPATIVAIFSIYRYVAPFVTVCLLNFCYYPL